MLANNSSSLEILFHSLMYLALCCVVWLAHCLHIHKSHLFHLLRWVFVCVMMLAFNKIKTYYSLSLLLLLFDCSKFVSPHPDAVHSLIRWSFIALFCGCWWRWFSKIEIADINFILLLRLPPHSSNLTAEHVILFKWELKVNRNVYLSFEMIWKTRNVHMYVWRINWYST